MSPDGKFNFARKACSTICDICGQPRTKGRAAANHQKCSKARQAYYMELSLDSVARGAGATNDARSAQ